MLWIFTPLILIFELNSQNFNYMEAYLWIDFKATYQKRKSLCNVEKSNNFNQDIKKTFLEFMDLSMSGLSLYKVSRCLKMPLLSSIKSM